VPPVPAAGALNKASALLAVSALADSVTEHYRGSFHNPVMTVPVAVGVQTLASSLHAVFKNSEDRSLMREVSQGAAVVAGVVGTGFHFYNILKRPGGWSWHNLFYAAPIGAPMALSLAGLLGSLAERLRDDGDSTYGIRPPVLVTTLTIAGLLGTSAEAALLHFRGAYQNPAMFIPVILPPASAALLWASYRSSRWIKPTRASLHLLAAVGLLGSAFHAYGIQRSMGGWRNWSQNILSGPPLPAPPAFTALAIAGLGALRLLEVEA
jgi:hypothetical protein